MVQSDSFKTATKMESPRSWWIAALLFFAIFTGLNYRLLTGDYSAILDADQEFIPYYTLIADSIRSGELMIWNLFMNGGEPTGVDPQAGSFSPLHLAVGLVVGGVEGGFRLIWFVFWLAGAFGVMMLGKHFKAGPWGSLAVALGYAFSGMYIGQAQHTPLLYTMSVFPWVLWRFDSGLQKRSFFSACQAGALLGMSGLGGYPILTMLGGIFLGLWALGHAATKGFERPSLIHAAIATALAGAICIIVFSPSILGLLYETKGFSDRAEPLLRSYVISSNTMLPGAFVTVLNPVFGMLPFYNPDLWKGLDWSFAIQYTGVLIPVLAASAVMQKRAYKAWWIVLILVIFVSFSLGTTLPFRGWLYDLIENTRYWRNSVLFQCFYFIGVSVLALMGLNRLNAGIEQQKFSTIFVVTPALFLVFSLLAFAYIFNIYKAPEATFTFSARIQSLMVGGGVTAAFWWLIKNKTPKSVQVCYVILIVASVADAWFTMEMNNTLVVKQAPEWREMSETHDPSIDQTERGLHRVFAVDPVYTNTGLALVNNKNIPQKQPTFKGITALRNRFHIQSAEEKTLYQYALGKDRIWFAADGIEARPTDAVFKAFKNRSNQLGRPPLLIHSKEKQWWNSPKEVMPIRGIKKRYNNCKPLCLWKPVDVSLIRYNSNHLEFECQAPVGMDGWW